MFLLNKKHIHELQSNISVLDTEKAQLKEQLDATETIITDLRNDINNSKEENKKLNHHNSELIQTNEAKDKEISDLNDQKAEIMANLATKETEYQAIVEDKALLEQQVASQKTNIEELEAKIQTLEQEKEPETNE